jgi:hypothetical protein
MTSSLRLGYGRRGLGLIPGAKPYTHINTRLQLCPLYETQQNEHRTALRWGDAIKIEANPSVPPIPHSTYMHRPAPAQTPTRPGTRHTPSHPLHPHAPTQPQTLPDKNRRTRIQSHAHVQTCFSACLPVPSLSQARSACALLVSTPASRRGSQGADWAGAQPRGPGDPTTQLSHAVQKWAGCRPASGVVPACVYRYCY